MILDPFFYYLTFEKRFSEHTLTAYRSDIAQYQQFIKDSFEETNLLSSSSIYIRSWMVQLMEQGLGVRSIRRKQSVLNSFFKFAIKQEYLENNPMEQVSTPKIQKKLPNYLREVEIQHLFRILPKSTDYPSARDRTIIELLISTGMRRAELINLELRDIRLPERTIRVFGKRKKERIVPMTTEMCLTIASYLSFRPKIETSQVFLTDQLKPLYPKFVYNLVKRYVSMVTAADDKGPHMLRHTFATLMLDEGADINAIKELLGHADLNATQVYTHTSIEKLKEAYGKAHPKAVPSIESD